MYLEKNVCLKNRLRKITFSQNLYQRCGFTNSCLTFKFKVSLLSVSTDF